MQSSDDTSQASAAKHLVFATTHWSVVLHAREASTSRAAEALGYLCRIYWYPLYAFVRRQGYSPPDAQDLTQEFFARFIKTNAFAIADQKRGKFRSFLLTSMKHFLVNEWAKAKALKRGGGHSLVYLDAQDGEIRYGREPVDTLTADRMYERRWALTLLEQVLGKLRQDYAAAGKLELFNELKPTLTGERNSVSYPEAAARLGMNETTLRVAVHRLRQRYGQLLRQEIANTVETEAEVGEELRFLLAALSN